MSDAGSSSVAIPLVCVVPFRWRDDRLECCLITSISSGHWIFPKGIVDPGRSPEQAALSEALEEAGLHGRIVGEPLGVYEDSKWGRPLPVTVLLMHVDQCDERWQEDKVRHRLWTDVIHASGLLSPGEHRRFAMLAAHVIASSDRL